jgi:hypothetical protein
VVIAFKYNLVGVSKFRLWLAKDLWGRLLQIIILITTVQFDRLKLHCRITQKSSGI